MPPGPLDDAELSEPLVPEVEEVAESGSPPPHPAKGTPKRRPRAGTPRRARREEWARIGLFPRI
jgi:hypothetical protein